MSLPGGVAHPVCYTLAEPGYCRKPTKRREGTRHFYDIFLQQAPNKPTWCWQGSQNPWGAVASQTSPFSGTMRQVHVAWRALGGGVSHPDSQGPAHCASQGSGGASRPSRDETSQPMLQFQTQDGMTISHTLTRGKGTVCPADCNETAYPQEGSLTLAKKALKNQRCETPGPSRAQRFSGNTKCIPRLIYTKHHEQVWYPPLQREEPARVTYSTVADVILHHLHRKRTRQPESSAPSPKKSNHKS